MAYMLNFCWKNTCELDIVIIRTVYILTTNKLIKLMMLWTTGPRFWAYTEWWNSVGYFNALCPLSFQSRYRDKILRFIFPEMAHFPKKCTDNFFFISPWKHSCWVTHNICFHGEMRKIIVWIFLLSASCRFINKCKPHLKNLNLTLVLLNPDIPCLCKQCRSRSVGFWRSQLIWICTVCH